MEKSQLSKLFPWLIFGSVVLILTNFGVGMLGGYLGTQLSGTTNSRGTTITNAQNVSVVDQSSAIIEVAEKASPGVVSIVISKDLPVYDQDPDDDFFGFPRRRQVGTERQEIGAGTGFIASADGLIITNRHVVADTNADYTVVLNNGDQLEAKVLARDTVLDIAIIKVEPGQNQLTSLGLGNSDSIKIGQTAIAIGNSLGRFSNSVSAGIISGLRRSITASSRDGQDAQLLEGVLQTDASINPGNSGGPLLDVAGNVIGVNVAIAQGAENIGFAIPINLVKPVLTSVQQYGEIRRPYLGVRYVTVSAELAETEKLDSKFGALVRGSNSNPAVVPNSPAAKAGLREGDIIIKINNIELNQQTSLQTEIQKYTIGEEITVTYIRDGRTADTRVRLERMP
jgi:serine protease Do